MSTGHVLRLVSVFPLMQYHLDLLDSFRLIKKHQRGLWKIFRKFFSPTITKNILQTFFHLLHGSAFCSPPPKLFQIISLTNFFCFGIKISYYSVYRHCTKNKKPQQKGQQKEPNILARNLKYKFEFRYIQL